MSTSDNTAPLSNSRTYTVALSNERRFEGGWWLYPGDILQARGSIPSADGASLILSAKTISADSVLSVKLRSGGEVLLEKTISAETLTDEPLALPLSAANLSEVELELSVTGHIVLQDARLEWRS